MVSSEELNLQEGQLDTKLLMTSNGPKANPSECVEVTKLLAVGLHGLFHCSAPNGGIAFG